MSIQAPQGILNIPNATLRVGRLEISEVVGADTALNTIARNTILLVDDDTYHVNKNWGLKLPNAWAGEFECNTASAGNYSEFNFYNEGASSNAQGYNLTFNDTAVQLRYDGSLLTSGSIASTVTGTGVKKVRLMFERNILSVTVDGTLVFTYTDTSGPRPRVYSTTAGGFLNFFTDGGALKNLKIVNEKWISDGTSNIAYVGGGEVSITGSLGVASNVTAANSFSLDTNGTFKWGLGYNGTSDGKNIKMSKYIASASNMKIATGLYTGSAYQWVSMRVRFTRLNHHTQIIQLDYLGSESGSAVKNPIVIGDSPGNSQDNEVVVYNKTSTGEYEIYLQIDSATTIDVEIYHRGSTIDEHYATLTTANSGAIDETGLTKIYDSGTHADFSLRDKNVIISDDEIYDNLLNYGDTQSILIDRGVAGGVGTVTADTTYDPPPGVIGDVVCKFQNNAGGEAVTNNFVPPGLTCSTGDKFTFGVWALATQNMGMEFFVNPAGPGSAVVGWQVIGDGNWRFYQNTVTTASGASNTTAFFRVDNNTSGSAVYLTGATIRKNPTSGVILPYTPRYSPNSGKGTVLATRNLIAKEAHMKTLLVGGGGTAIYGKMRADNLYTQYINTGTINYAGNTDFSSSDAFLNATTGQPTALTTGWYLWSIHRGDGNPFERAIGYMYRYVAGSNMAASGSLTVTVLSSSGVSATHSGNNFRLVTGNDAGSYPTPYAIRLVRLGLEFAMQ